MFDDNLALIDIDDYLDHINEKLELYEMIQRIVRFATNLPKGALYEDMATHIGYCAIRSESLFNSWGIDGEYLAGGDVRHLTELIENELLSPDEAGYVLDDDDDYDFDFYDDDADDDLDALDIDFDYDLDGCKDATSALLSVSSALTDCAKLLLDVVSEGLAADE